MSRIVVGMSGGVDSSVTAALLVEAGHEVSGVYVEAYKAPGCRSEDDRRDALKVATKLGIPFQVLDLKKEYKKRVVNYFLSEYRAGRTPNPDVVCNGEIKFGLLLDWALSEGYDKLATGHYCRTVCENPKSKILNPKQIQNTKSKNVKQKRLLKRPRDLGKDQTYFLWRVGPDRLEHVMFPLGEITKTEVRAKASEMELPNADKPDSMGVCMMGELDTPAFLKEELGEKPGEVVMQTQNSKFKTQNHNEELITVGSHKGLWFSTIGQRVGAEISLQGQALKAMGMDTTKMPVLYVIGKNIEENRVIIGVKEDVWVSQVTLEQVEWYTEERDKLLLRVRNLGEMVPVARFKTQDSRIKIETVEKMWGIAPGQSGVLYSKGGVVVGGGVIV